MQLDYKDIIIKHYALSMSGSEIARQTGFSKSGVNDFLRAFKKCEDLNYPLPAGITNYGIALPVKGSGQPILITCQIIIKDSLSGMDLTLSRKRNSLARIQRLLSGRSSNPDHTKYRPIVCA